MLFNSLTFLLAFLPATLMGFWIAGRFGNRAAAGWLVLMSYVFYCAWQPENAWFPLVSLLVNCAIAWRMRAQERRRLALLWAGVAFNVGLLFIFKLKVANAQGEFGNLAAAFSTTQDIIIPLAISFVTFQQIAFLYDIYKKRLQAPD